MALVDFHGLQALQVTSPDGAQATVTLHGAHIVSWKTPDGYERLYLSERSAFTPGKPIRGGIPVVFPQFSSYGELPRHGFARQMLWRLEKEHQGSEFVGATLSLSDSPETRSLWPFEFTCELTFSVTRTRMDVEFSVENRGKQAFTFSGALHTYLAVDDLEGTLISGLQGCTYRDQTAGNAEHVESAALLSFRGETDRIYLTAPQEVMLRDGQRSMSLSCTQFPDLVVWNPGQQKGAQIADMPPDGYKRMVCVEPAVVETPVRLAPGDEWWGRQTLVATR